MIGATDYQLGNQMLAAKKYEEAIAHFVRHAERVPADAARAFERAGVACQRSNALPSPVEVAPGLTLVSQGNRERAEAFFRLALERAPSHPRSLKGLASVLATSSDERCAVLERLVEVQPDFMALVDLADFYRSHRKDYARAHDLYVRAQNLSPGDRTVHVKLQDICKKLGRPDEAEEWRRSYQVQKTNVPPRPVA